MERWANFVIKCVTHDPATGKIVSVDAMPDLGDIFGPSATWPRDLVVKALDRGFTFCTALGGTTGNVSKGALVEVVLVRGEKFIRTDRNSVKADNLGSLPSC